MTGVESALLPAISKAAGGGAARIGGWAMQQGLEAHRKRATKKALNIPAKVHREFSEPAKLARLLAYFEAPEADHFAYAVAQAYLLEHSNKQAAALLSNLENEFYYSLARWLGEQPPLDVIKLLFAAFQEAVFLESARVSTTAKQSPAVRAHQIQTAASLASASVRNASLLKGLYQQQEIHDFQVSLNSQIVALHGAMKLPHAGTTRQVPYDELFVTPDLWFPPSTNSAGNGSAQLGDALRVTNRILILGDPGGGKSTLAHKLTHDLAAGLIETHLDRTPFLVTLREYALVVGGANRRTVIEYLAENCKSPYQIAPPEDALEYLFLNDRGVVIFDGLDELLDTSQRRDVVQAVEAFASHFPTCPIVVTSRRVGYEEAPLDENSFTRLELGKFSPKQVSSYVEKWFKLDDSIPDRRRAGLTRAFLQDSLFVEDLRSNPLLLSLMCGIYASENYIPQNRPDVYEKCANLLFERWDKQRGITSSLPFDAHVRGALRALALNMFTKHSAEDGISRKVLERYVSSYLRSKRFDNDEEAEHAAEEFIDFCKGRAWVLTDVGAEIYGFTHRTFMEYFAATQLVRLHPNASSLFAYLLPRLREENWDVVAQLCLQILDKTVDDGADDFLSLLLDEFVGSEPNGSTLLRFACRALEFVVPRPSVVERIANVSIDYMLMQCRTDSGLDKRGTLVMHSIMRSTSVENQPRIGAALRTRLQTELAKDRTNYVALSLSVALPNLRMPEGSTPTEFWKAWADENLQLLESTVRRQIDHRSWVANLAVERGLIQLEEGFRRRGPRLFYEYVICGLITSPPTSYRMLSAVNDRYRSTEGKQNPPDLISPFFGGAPHSVDDIEHIIVHEFPKYEGAWVRYSHRLDPLVSIASAALGIRDGESLRTPAKWAKVQRISAILALPLVEYEVVKLAPSASDHGFARKHIFTRYCTGAREVLAADELTEDILGSLFADRRYSGAVELIRRWMADEVSLLSHKPRRRILPRGKSEE